MNIHRPLTQAALATAGASAPSISRHDQLGLQLLTTVDLLHRRRADLIADGFIEDYVALHWLEWNGGALRLTITGTNMCDQMRARLS